MAALGARRRRAAIMSEWRLGADAVRVSTECAVSNGLRTRWKFVKNSKEVDFLYKGVLLIFVIKECNLRIAD